MTKTTANISIAASGADVETSAICIAVLWLSFIEEGNHSKDEIQSSFDMMTLGINELEDEFGENESEIETGARESIGDTIDKILTYFNIDIEIEEAIREREW